MFHNAAHDHYISIYHASNLSKTYSYKLPRTKINNKLRKRNTLNYSVHYILNQEVKKCVSPH